MTLPATRQNGVATFAQAAEDVLGAAFRGARYIGPKLWLATPLTDSQRSILTQRLAELRPLLEPGDAAHVGVIIGRLFGAFTHGLTDPDDIKTKFRVYATALAEVPKWVLSEVAVDVVKGKFGALRFVPTPPELAVMCATRMAPLKQERRIINHVLDARAETPLKPAAREVMQQKFADLIREIRANGSAGADAIDPGALSPAAIAGLTPAKPAGTTGEHNERSSHE